LSCRRVGLGPQPMRLGSQPQHRVRARGIGALVAALIFACNVDPSRVLRASNAQATFVPLRSGTSGDRAGLAPVSVLATRSLLARQATEDPSLPQGDMVNRMMIGDLVVGQKLSGIVTRVCEFGCFVDVGAERPGLVHISRVTDAFCEDIESVVQPGQGVTVWVVGVNEEGKLSLSMIEEQQERGSECKAFEDVAPDEWLTATVQSATDFGLIVSLAPPGGGPVAQGMVHISQIKEGFVEHPAEEAEIGQEVRVRVLETNPRLRLSMKELRTTSGPPSGNIAAFQGVSPEEWLQGEVQYAAPFGIFVKLDAPDGSGPFQGLVHVSQIRNGFVDNPAEEAKAGEVVRVRITHVDVQGGKLSLSMKPLA